MRKMAFVLLVGVLSLTAVAAYASAGSSYTREGKAANGIANPGGCDILPEGHDMHANCVHAQRPARIRYRFTKASAYPTWRGPANVSADIHTIKGKDCVIRWMAPVTGEKTRTARVFVPAGSYCHVRSVTVQQNATR